MSNRVRTILVIVITTVWFLSFLATLVIPEYKAPPEINSIFMATVGTVLATAPMVAGRRRQNNEEEGGEETGSSNQSERQP